MVILRVANYPALDKAQEYRSLVEESLMGLFRSRGLTAMHMTRILQDGGPELVNYINLGDMATYERFRQDNQSDAAFTRLISRLGRISRRGATMGLFVPIVQGTPPENARFFHRITIRPTLGDADEARSALEEFTRARQSEGRAGAALSRQILSPCGPAFVAVDRYQSLAEYEDDLVKQRPGLVAAVQQKLKGLLQSPVEQTMYETLSAE